MEYVNLGSAGVRVSRIALGLGFRGKVSEAAAQRVIEHAIDSGVNFLDCANMYGSNILLGNDREPEKGTTETVLGRVLKSRRDDVVITTKVHSPVGGEPTDRGGSRYHIMREAERSLQRLGTDHIDVYLLHQFDEDTPLEETLRALDDLVTQGKVRYVGACNFKAWQVYKALWAADGLNADPIICVQNPYNLLNRDLEREMFGVVRDQGLGVMVYSPLAIGLLSGRYGSADTPPPDSPWAGRGDGFRSLMAGGGAAVLDALRDVAYERGKTMAQVALNWVVSQPEVTVGILGSDTVEQVDDNLGAIGWELTDAEVKRLDEVSKGLAQDIF